MGESPSSHSPRLSLATLIAYGCSAGPLGAMAIVVFVFLPKVYDEITTISMTTLGLVFLAVRSWDVVSDPLIGWLSDKTRSRFGRRRPWVFLAWIPMSVALMALCTPPADATGLYLFAWSLVFFTAGTALFIPYTAWGAELSDDYHERSKVFAWRHVFAALGTLMAVAALLLFHDPDLELSREAQAIDPLVNIGVSLLLVTLLALLLRVRDPAPARPSRAPLGWARGFALIRANKPFQVLLGSYFLNGLANALPATLFLYFAEVILQADVVVPGLFLYFGLAILGTPIWVLLSRRWGKHRAWRAAMLISAAAYLTVPWIGPGDLVAFYAMIAVVGLTLGADLTLPGAMQADVVDRDRALSEDRPDERRTGIYFALWGMVAKMALALAVGISFPVLDLFGFDVAQPAETGGATALVVLFATVPMLFKLAASYLVGRYTLTREVHAAILAELAARSGR